MRSSAGSDEERDCGTRHSGRASELDPQQYALAPEAVREERGEGSCERGRNHAHDSDDPDAGRTTNVVREDRERDDETPFGDDRRPVHDLHTPQRRIPKDRPVCPGHLSEPPSHRMHGHSIFAWPSRGRQPAPLQLMRKRDSATPTRFACYPAKRGSGKPLTPGRTANTLPDSG